MTGLPQQLTRLTDAGHDRGTRSWTHGPPLETIATVVGDFAYKVHAITGTSDAEYTIRQAAYDLRKLRGKQLVDKPGRTRRYRVAAQAARTIAALLTLRHQVIAPILAGIRSPRMGRKPKAWTSIDRDYAQIRMQTVFDDLALTTPAPLAA